MKVFQQFLWLLAASSILDGIWAEDPGDTGDASEDSTQYRHFVAHNKTMTCTADEHATPFNNAIRGTNLGGWMVLEPWITPSLFYQVTIPCWSHVVTVAYCLTTVLFLQFLGQDENTTAFDTYTFCKVLGPKEANKQLRRHWDTWVTEEIIQELYDSGAVNSLRLPLGDYQFKPYGPYRE